MFKSVYDIDIDIDKNVIETVWTVWAADNRAVPGATQMNLQPQTARCRIYNMSLILTWMLMLNVKNWFI